MPAKLKKQGRQLATGKSEGRIVPLKPGNSGGGKAAEPSRDLNWASSGHRAGTAVLTQAPRSVSFDVGDGGPVVVAELSKFYSRFRAGKSEAEVFIHVQVKKAKGGLVYSEIVEGKGINSKGIFRSGENAKIALEAAMQDAVNRLMTNVEFLDAIIEARKS